MPYPSIAPYPLAAFRLAMADRQPLAVVIGATLLKLLIILVLVHPVLSSEGDAPGYLAFAQSIAGDGQWLHPPSWVGDPLPTFLIRLVGYPLVMAGAMSLGGEHFVSVLLLFQIAISTIALLVIIGLAAAVIESRIARMLFAIALCFGSPFLYDLVGLSDGLYAALFSLVVFGIAGEIAGIWRLGLVMVTALGVIWAYSILIRDAGLYFTIFPLFGLLLLDFYQFKINFFEKMRRSILFAIPIIATILAYSGFNSYRTGYFFFSVAGVVNYLHPVFRIAEAGYARPLDGQDLISTTYHRIGAQPDLAGIVATVSTVMQSQNLNTLDAAALTKAKLIDTIYQYPQAYIHLVLVNLKLDKQAFNLTNPTYIINDLLAFGPFVGARTMPGFQQTFRELRHHFSFGVFLTFAATEFFDIPSMLLFGLFLFGVPIVVFFSMIKRKIVTKKWWLAFYLWLSYVGLVLAYALVHFEIRYMLPVVPSALLAMAITIEALRERYRSRSL